MNLRNAGSYHIGLDLGTGSVGWCVVDDAGELYHIKGKPAWGSRLFSNAETAAETRAKRGQRRRYDRRRSRLDCLQRIFAEEMEKVDPEFFVRMNQSRLLEKDRDPAHTTTYDHPFFNGTDFTEWDYYDKFPTIYHLRKYLMDCDEKADIRLVYLALHNIVKYRGNFLHEGESNLKASTANAQTAAETLADELENYAQILSESREEDISCNPDVEELQAALEERGVGKAARSERIQSALGTSDKDLASGVAYACAGRSTEFSKIFEGLQAQDGSKFELSNDVAVDEFFSLCPDEGMPLFDAMQAAYSASVLSDLLRGQSSLSAAMVESYKQHKHDLKQLKGLVKDYLPMEYDKLFRGDKDPKDPKAGYNINNLPPNSYTAYIEGETLANKKGCTQEELIKNIQRLCKKSDDLQQDPRFLDIQGRLYADDGEFLAKQKTRANGAIPYQLHLEEMDVIIENQGRYYPFLLENKELMDKLVSSRIPYYVGPLYNRDDQPENAEDFDSKDSHVIDSNDNSGKRNFAWAVRKPGMERNEIHVWNYEEAIDTDETAEQFIRRMTGKCTYLYAEDVLPRHSLLYEEFCVLNELNGARWGRPGQDSNRFDVRDRQDIFDELFCKHKTVTNKAVSVWLERRRGFRDAQIEGTQDKSGFKSKLESYNDFCSILQVDSLDDEKNPLASDEIEEIILWNTVFEDRDIFKRKLQQKYGNRLSNEQINKLVKKRYQGWGRFSKKFLCGLKTDTQFGPLSIMDILRDGDPITGHHSRAMTLMEILHEDRFTFEQKMEEENRKTFREDGNKLSVDDLPGSPANRRTVNQAMRIVEELVGIAGHEPTSIVIEVTRDEGEKKPTTSRYNHLKEQLKAYKQDVNDFDPDLLKQLEEKKGALSKDHDDCLMLYFSQAGKCMYSGEALDINRLQDYQIDHILPQAYIKDDSLDNRVLVKSTENQRKKDSMLLNNNIINKRRGWWKALKEAKLISEKKYKNLTRADVSPNAMKGFINRQLVETSQIVKFVRQMCLQNYPNTEIVSLKASLSTNLRSRCELAKSRNLNDYHHAHDAYLACQLARFLRIRYPVLLENGSISNAIIANYIKELTAQNDLSGRKGFGSAGFIVDSFMRNSFNRETGEVLWDQQAEKGKIERTLNSKYCFISRMTEEHSDAFWNETIYSPKSTGQYKPKTPLKGAGTERELDPADYGGYGVPYQAYFFIFQAETKKGQTKFFFEGVPIYLEKKLGKSSEALTEFAETIAEENGCFNARILRKKVPIKQKFELDETEFYLFGRDGKANEIRPASQIVLEPYLTALIVKAADEPKSVSDEDYERLYLRIAEKLEITCPKLSAKLALSDHKKKFDLLEAENKNIIIKNILITSHAGSKACDLRLIGEAEKSGRMRINIATYLPRITWIDQSVTGIFETRTTLEDMQKNLR